jgi:hypothetical protein
VILDDVTVCLGEQLVLGLDKCYFVNTYQLSDSTERCFWRSFLLLGESSKLHSPDWFKRLELFDCNLQTNGEKFVILNIWKFTVDKQKAKNTFCYIHSAKLTYSVLY